MLCVFVFLTALRNPKDLRVCTKVICEHVNIKQSCELSQPDCQCMLCWPAWNSALLPTGPTADRTAIASFWEGGPPTALRGLPARTTASIRIEHESGRKGTGACAEITNEAVALTHMSSLRTPTSDLASPHRCQAFQTPTVNDPGLHIRIVSKSVIK